MFIHGARAVLFRVKYDTGGLGQWVHQLEARAARNKVIVAMANKLARIAWAVLFSGEHYRARRQLRCSLEVERRGSRRFSPGSARRKNRTKQQSNGVPENLGREMVEKTEGFIRTGTRGSSSWPGAIAPTRGRIHLRRLIFAHHSLLQSDGGPYILAICPVLLLNSTRG